MEKEKAISILKDTLKMDTTLSNEKEMADYLEKLLNQAGIETEQVTYSDGRNQLIATLKGEKSGKTLGFTGHMDVVPVGEIPWKHEPFAAEEEAGKIYARGAADMKSGLVAQVIAMIDLKENHVPLNGDIRLLATVGEETSAIGAGQLTKLGFGNDLDGLVIGEPTSNRVIIAHKGALWFRLKTLGHTAHGSMPDKGVNAIDHMLALLNRFKETFDFSVYKDPLVGASTSSIDIIHGGNGTNVVPDLCTVEIDIRTIAGQSHEEIKKQMQQIVTELEQTIPDFKAEIEVINDLGSVRTAENDELVVKALQAVKEVTGETKHPEGLTGYTDGSQFVKADKKFPIIVLGSGNVELAHQPDEYVCIDEFMDTIEINKKLAQSFLN